MTDQKAKPVTFRLTGDQIEMFATATFLAVIQNLLHDFLDDGDCMDGVERYAGVQWPHLFADAVHTVDSIVEALEAVFLQPDIGEAGADLDA